MQLKTLLYLHFLISGLTWPVGSTSCQALTCFQVPNRKSNLSFGTSCSQYFGCNFLFVLWSFSVVATARTYFLPILPLFPSTCQLIWHFTLFQKWSKKKKNYSSGRHIAGGKTKILHDELEIKFSKTCLVFCLPLCGCTVSALSTLMQWEVLGILVENPHSRVKFMHPFRSRAPGLQGVPKLPNAAAAAPSWHSTLYIISCTLEAKYIW